MFARGGVLSVIFAIARLDLFLRAARIFRPLPGWGAILKAAMAAAMLAAPAAAQARNTAATVTIEADRESHNDEGPEGPASIATIAFVLPAGTYAIADRIAFRVVFDKPVTVAETEDLEPELEFDIGGTARRASYRSGSGGTALLFGYNVVEGDLDTDGIAIGPDPLRAAPGSLAGPGGTDVSLSHPGLPADPAQKVDGVRPTAMFAMVDDGNVAITWDEPLMAEEGLGLPGGFVLVVGGVTRAIDGVAAGGRRITLGVSPAIEESEWVTVSYTPPDARPVRDLAGNRAAGFAMTVTAGERGICQRTPVVRERIVALLRQAVRPGYSGDCGGVTPEMPARIRSMDIVPPVERVTELSGMRSLYIVEQPGLSERRAGDAVLAYRRARRHRSPRARPFWLEAPTRPWCVLRYAAPPLLRMRKRLYGANKSPSSRVGPKGRIEASSRVGPKGRIEGRVTGTVQSGSDRL